jgi:hypothetical protein
LQLSELRFCSSGKRVDAIALRRRKPEFVAADYASLSAEGVWAFGHADRHVVVIQHVVRLARARRAGTMRVCTDRARHLKVASSLLAVAAYEGLILECS